MRGPVLALLQFVALLLVGLIAGGVFSIWFGYDVSAYTQATFVEVHQRAVRGLNDVLPLMGLGAITCVIVLAVLARRDRSVLAIYVLVVLALIAAGVITRFGNQPINATVMTWTPDTVPPEWQSLARTWWMWHGWRVAASILAFLCLIVAVLADRRGTTRP